MVMHFCDCEISSNVFGIKKKYTKKKYLVYLPLKATIGFNEDL